MLVASRENQQTPKLQTVLTEWIIAIIFTLIQTVISAVGRELRTQVR